MYVPLWYEHLGITQDGDFSNITYLYYHSMELYRFSITQNLKQHKEILTKFFVIRVYSKKPYGLSYNSLLV